LPTLWKLSPPSLIHRGRSAHDVVYILLMFCIDTCTKCSAMFIRQSRRALLSELWTRFFLAIFFLVSVEESTLSPHPHRWWDGYCDSFLLSLELHRFRSVAHITFINYLDALCCFFPFFISISKRCSHLDWNFCFILWLHFILGLFDFTVVFYFLASRNLSAFTTTNLWLC
jgi:hypothetical protein